MGMFNSASDSCNSATERPKRRSFFGRPLSISSVNTLASLSTVKTTLPQYSVIDEPSASHPETQAQEDSLLSATASDITLVNPRRLLPPIPLTITVPPRYSLLSKRSSVIPTSSPGSPTPSGDYENTVRLSGFRHSFPIRSNKPWAILSTFTPKSVPGLIQEGRAKSKLPRFFGNEPMLGMVELDLESSQTIQQISITLRGKIVTGYLVDESYTFLDDKRILWHKSMGNPPSPSTALPSETPAKTSRGKLIGSYQIPFSFPFPNLFNIKSTEAIALQSSPSSPLSPRSPESFDTVWPSSPDRSSPVASSSRSPVTPHSPWNPSGRASRRLTAMDESTNQEKITPTPQSFMETGVTASVQYELIVHITHGFLRPDSRIKTGVFYVPTITSPYVSFKRQQAYEHGAIAPGPLSDPEGWFSLQRSVITGQLGGKCGRKVKIECTLFLANPLSYTRGTFIPCYLTFSGDDSDALNVLSTPNNPNVRLIRRLRHFCPHGGDGVPERNVNTRMEQNLDTASAGVNPMNGVLPFAAGGSGKGSSLKTVITEVGKAVWWIPPKDVPQELYTRHLEGEIHLSPDLQPTSLCSIFQVEYFLEMLPLSSSGFEHTPTSNNAGKLEVLTSHPVQIATLYSPESPVPVAFTEPPNTGKKSN